MVGGGRVGVGLWGTVDVVVGGAVGVVGKLVVGGAVGVVGKLVVDGAVGVVGKLVGVARA